MNELLKENEEFKNLYNEEEKRCFDRVNGFIACSELEIRNALHYVLHQPLSQKEIELFKRILNLDEDISQLSEEKIEYLVKEKATLNRLSVYDCRFLYECSLVLDQNDLKKVGSYYHINDYNMNLYIKEGEDSAKSGVNKRQNKYRELIGELENIDNEDEIIAYLEGIDLDTTAFKRELCNVLVNYYPGRYEELHDQTVEKINIYRNYLNEKKSKEREQKKIEKREKELVFAHDTVSKFVHSTNKNINHFCKEKDIDIKEFNKYINLIKEEDVDLYADYSDKIEKKKKENYAIIATKIEEVSNYIKNGIVMETGEKRKFDIVDYYMVQKYEPSNFLKISKGVLNRWDYNDLKLFFSKNKILDKQQPFYVKGVLEEVTEVDCKKDKNGLPIQGTGRIVAEEEKLSIMDYLKNNGVPLTSRTYNVAFRRYLNHQLFEQKEINKNNGSK